MVLDVVAVPQEPRLRRRSLPRGALVVFSPRWGLLSATSVHQSRSQLSKNGDKSVTFGRFLMIFESFSSKQKMYCKSETHHKIFCHEVPKRNKDLIVATFCSHENSEQCSMSAGRAPEWKILGKQYFLLFKIVAHANLVPYILYPKQP